MINVEDWMDIHLLKNSGHSNSEIARLTGHSRNTVAKMLKLDASQAYTRSYKTRSSKLDEFKPYLESRFQEFGLSAVRLLDEIRPQGYTGSVDLIRRYLQTLKPLNKAIQKATVRFETPPGEQAQVDWAYCSRFIDPNGETVPIYAFVMVLGFSRMLYVEFTTSMELPVLIQCHQNACQYFEGWPKSILYDNMKQIKLGPGEFHPLFLDFALHHGFMPKTHRVRRPRTKGKVERMVEYVRGNFLNGRSFSDLADLNVQVRQWLETTANTRIHATTNQRPKDLWSVEKASFTQLFQITPYQIIDRQLRRVSSESFVHLNGSRYSVPPEIVGQSVVIEVKQGQQHLIIRSNNLIVAEHPLAKRKGECITNPAHLEALWKLSLAHNPPAPAAHYNLTFSEAVMVRPLSSYEAIVG